MARKIAIDEIINECGVAAAVGFLLGRLAQGCNVGENNAENVEFNSVLGRTLEIRGLFLRFLKKSTLVVFHVVFRV